MSYYVLKGLAALGIVSHLRTPSERVLTSNRIGDRAGAPAAAGEALSLPVLADLAAVTPASVSAATIPTHVLTSPVKVSAELPPAA